MYSIGVSNFNNKRLIDLSEIEEIELNSMPSETYQLRKDDILFVRSNGNKELVGRMMLIDYEPTNLFYSGFIIRGRLLTNQLQPDFLLNQENNIKYQLKILTGGTNITNLSQDILNGITLRYPRSDEQKKIGTFFSTLDKRIKAEQKKLMLLQEQKKGYVKKIFSREWRFKDEDGNDYPNWEHKIIRNILTEAKKNKVENPSEIMMLTVKLYCKGVVNSGKFPNSTSNSRPYYIRNSGELIIGRQNFHNGGIALVTDECDGLIASNAISSFIVLDENEVDIRFLYYSMSRKEYYSKIDDLIGGTGQKEISVSEIGKLKLDIPTIKEQQKIVYFLSVLVNNIENAEKKVELLKKQRDGLMQQMFI